MLVFILGLVVFLGIHSIQIIAPAARNRMVVKLGNGWKGIYSLVALAGIVLMVIGYRDAQAVSPFLWVPPVFLMHLNLILAPVALVLVIAGSVPAGYIQKALKHPMLVGVKLWALGHLLANGDLFSLIFFGSFLAWAVVDRISVKRRAVDPALVHAPPRIVWDAVSVVGGLAISVALIGGLHIWLFGVSPVAMGG